MMKKKIIAALAACALLASIPMTQARAEEYVYCVGSVSKMYATTAVMKLVDEGKVELDGPVSDYIPDFELADERYKDITVRMLMDHTSGIMGTSLIAAFGYGHSTDHDDAFMKTLATQRLKADPGEYAAYCNDGFDLLALIVENVTGESYTDYIEKELAAPTGGKSTGTAANYEKLGTHAPAFAPGNLPMDFGVTEPLGAGGVYSTASDVANFGAAFFENSDLLLSEKAKKEMAIRWDEEKGEDPYKDDSGLGWDDVHMSGYREAGVTVVLKGGDTMTNHAMLMVAPEEEISVAVLTDGGTSALNGLLAESIMQTVLEDRGIVKVTKEAGEYEFAPEIPAEYDRYEGFYSSSDTSGGAVIAHVTFPDHKYMHVENIGPFKTTVTDLMLIKEAGESDGSGRFVELAYELDEDGDTADGREVKAAVDPEVISFKEENGRVYLLADYDTVYPGLGRLENKKYVGEKMDENPVDQATLDAWDAAARSDMLLVNDPAESSGYENGIVQMSLSKEMPGYAYFNIGRMGSRVMKLTDPTHAVAFQTIPSSTNRDSVDATLTEEEGRSILSISSGLSFVTADAIPTLDRSVSKVELKTCDATWYKVGEELANSSVTVTRDEGCEIYAYNKYGSMIYTTHVLDAAYDVPLPADGYVVFVGKTGDVVKIS